MLTKRKRQREEGKPQSFKRNKRIPETSPGFQKQKEDDSGHCDPAWEPQSHTTELGERQP